MRIDILTIFPEVFEKPLDFGMIKRAKEKAGVEFNAINLRDFTHDKHRSTDDVPFGGGEGMVMKIEPFFEALQGIKKETTKVLLMSASGKKLTQKKLMALSKETHLVFVCGRYEGFDERAIQFVDEEICIGDYVLSGGEFATLVIIEGMMRLIPGVLGNEESSINESFTTEILDYPHYTRPREFAGMNVPEVLFSGNHAEIKKWRARKALEKTYKNRPDLLDTAKLTKEQKAMLESIKKGET